MTENKAFENTLTVIYREIYNCQQRRKFYRKEIKAEMPYKCRTKTEAAKRRKEFKRDVVEINAELREYRKAIKILNSK